VWDRLTDRRSRRAVEVAERYADGKASDRELYGAGRVAYDVLGLLHPSPRTAGVYEAADCADADAWAAVNCCICTPTATPAAAQVALLRCVFGDPFRPVAVRRSWLAWNGRTVIKLAAAIYEERRFADLPILADALEDAGCADAAILAHCRGGGEHVRGCWAVDLLTGRQ
jgi:hypothetical protein